MDSLELDVISKLNNTFLFNFKMRNFAQFQNHDALNVYQFLFRVYDPSWVLKDDKPTPAILKQIQNYFQRLELGHLVTRADDLLDNTKLCRLLGGLISKLESRYNNSKNLGAAVRKVKNQKIKPMQEKPKSIEKPSGGSSQGSVGDISEENTPEIPITDVIPNKGREIPRTPENGGSKQENPNQTYQTDGPLLSAKNGDENLDSGTKPFHPILPTKEIPRTPLNGNRNKDGPPGNRHLNFTYEFSPLVSNASTPYSERAPLNATYVVPLVPQAPQSLDLSVGSDSVFSPSQKNPEMVNATFPVQAASDTIREPENSPEAKQPDVKAGESVADEGTFNLAMDQDKINTQKRKGFRILSTDSPSAEAPTKKNRRGRKGKQVQADMDRGEAAPQNTANPPESKGPIVKEVPGKAQAPTTETKQSRGKANVKADETEQTLEDSITVVPESKRPRGKGRKEKTSVEQEKDSAVSEAQRSKSRGKKPSSGGDKHVLEQDAMNANVIPASEVKKPRGREKKTTSDGEKQILEHEKTIPKVKRQRGRGQKPFTEEDEEVPEQDKVDPPTSEPKKKRGRAQKSSLEEESKVPQQEKSSPSVPEPKLQRGRAKIAAVEGEKPVLKQEKSDQLVPEPQKQRGKAQKATEAQAMEQGKADPSIEQDTAKPPATEPKRQRGKGQKQPIEEATTPMEQDEVDPPVPEPKKQRGRAVKGTRQAIQEQQPLEQSVGADVPGNKKQRSKGQHGKQPAGEAIVVRADSGSKDGSHQYNLRRKEGSASKH